MSTIPDITIIGGGIMGLLTARACRLAGAKVTILEQNQIGRESSWAGGGILLPIYPWRHHDAVSKLVIQSLTLYPSLIASIQQSSQIDPEFIQSGMLICKNPDYNDALSWCDTYAIRHTPASSELLNKFTTDYDQPLWLPDIYQARNPRLLKSVYADLVQLGVEFIADSELKSLHISNQRVHAITTSTGDYPIGQIVLTTGSWTGRLWQQLFADQQSTQPKINPVKGQMLLFEAQPDTLDTMVLDDAHYLIPRRDGKILAGSTVEQADFDKSTDPETKAHLTHFAHQLLPALQQFPIIAHWAGLRPGTEQGIPYIAKHPELKNLSINAGHFRNGLTLAPASAELLTDLLFDRPPKLDPTPYQFNAPH